MPDVINEEDQDIEERIQLMEGDELNVELAITTLYDRYGERILKRLHKHAYLIDRDRQQCLIDAIIALQKKALSDNPPDWEAFRFGAWLFRVADNKAKDLIRKGKRENEKCEHYAKMSWGDAGSEVHSYFQWLERRGLKERFEEAIEDYRELIESLPPKQKDICRALLAIYQEGYENGSDVDLRDDDVARRMIAMGVPPENIGSIKKAKQVIKAKFAELLQNKGCESGENDER